MPFEYYEVLGINKNASQDDIKRAYKKLAIEHHPDKGGDEKKFQELSNAYNVLCDPQKRAEYDMTGSDNPGGRRQNSQNAHDIFKHFFHQQNNFQQQQQRKVKKCNDATHKLNITLEDAANGIKKQFKIKLKVYDKSCFKKCIRCDGNGETQNVRNMGIFTQVFTSKCVECNGSGTATIKGKENNSMTEKECMINLDIPIGVTDDYQMVIEGKGEQPKTDGIIPGNLIFIINIKPHNKFARNANNLVWNVSIDFIASVVGETIPVNILGLEQFDLDLKTLGIIQPNRDYIFPKKGMPILNDKTKRGDLIVRFSINYPNLTENQRQHLREAMKTILHS
eukprot:762478-Hanusia_phi.AAC.14